MLDITAFLPELSPFEPKKIQGLLGQLQNEIQIGLKRISQDKPPTQDDGGLLAIPYPVGRPTPEQLLSCPPQRVLGCVFAGQNWKAEVWRWNGNEWQGEEATKVKRVITEKERVFKGKNALDRFIKLMAATAQAALKKANKPAEISKIAVSFGFPQKNEKVDYGIEASLLVDHPAKHWLVEGAAGKKLGQMLLAELKRRGFETEKIFFANDTLAVAMDTMAGQKTLPVGLVIGNGANMAIESGGVLVNLESNKSQALGGDTVIRKMYQLDLLPKPPKKPILEYYFSGAYQLPRLIASLYLLAERLKTPPEWAKALSGGGGKGLIFNQRVAQHFLRALKQEGNDARVLDWLITGEMDQEKLEEYLSPSPDPGSNKAISDPGSSTGNRPRPCPAEFTCPAPDGAGVSASDFLFLKQAAELVMAKAVEVAALMIASALQVGGWREGQIPAVGSVFWKARVRPDGQIFGDQVMRLVNQWTNGQFTPVPADELRGIASLALVSK